APLALMNLSTEAPARLAPLIVNIALAPRVRLTGEMLEIVGPLVTETNSLKNAGAAPDTKPNRSDTDGLRKGAGVLMIAPRRTDTGELDAMAGPLIGGPRRTETRG